MYIADRVLTIMQSALKSYGPANIKRLLWDKEYSGNKWDFADNTAEDCVYPHLERHAHNGSILDLGCGSGNTANELSATAYGSYLGVDISDVCLDKARKRTLETGRTDKNRFVAGDFLNFVPAEQFDVILFRESLYHVPIAKIASTLDRYGTHLKPNGVFIVRMKTSGLDGSPKARPTAMMQIVESRFEIDERVYYRNVGATVMVFRQPRSRRARNAEPS